MNLVDRDTFRGKRLEDGKWIFGDLIHESYWRTCIQYFTETGERHKTTIIPNTVGRNTGLLDKCSQKIWEHDILTDKEGFMGIVVWDARRGSWGLRPIGIPDLEILYPLYPICEALGICGQYIKIESWLTE